MDREQIKKRVAESTEQATKPIMSNAERLGFQNSTKTQLWSKPWFKVATLFGVSTLAGLLMYATGGKETAHSLESQDQELLDKIEALENENTKLKGIHVASLDRETQPMHRNRNTSKKTSSPRTSSTTTRATSSTRRPAPSKPPTRVVKVASVPRSQVPPVRSSVPPKPASTPPTPRPTAKPVSTSVEPASTITPAPKAQTAASPIPTPQTIEDQWLASAGFGFSPGGSSHAKTDYAQIPTISVPTDESLQGAYEPELVASASSEDSSSQTFPDVYEWTDDDRAIAESFKQKNAKVELLTPIAWAKDFDPTGDIIEMQLSKDFGDIPKKSILVSKVENITPGNIVELTITGFYNESVSQQLPPTLLSVRAKGGGPLIGQTETNKPRRKNNIGKKILNSVLSGASNAASNQIDNRDISSAVDGMVDPIIDDARSSRFGAQPVSSRTQYSILKAGTKLEIFVNKAKNLW